MIPGGEAKEAPEDRELEHERGFEQVAAYGAFGAGEARIGHVGGTIAVECFDDGGEAAEGGEDAARVDGAVVGDVVEDAGEDEVVC
jgi:hypothetical protein